MKYESYISGDEPKALKPQTKQEFGYFLAGLIDSDGHIRKNGSIVIAFNAIEASVAYYLRKIIGSGSVYKVKNKQAVTYECMDKAGQSVIADLIRNKLKHLDKIAQCNERLTKKLKCDITIFTDSDLKENHWLAGFIQGDGSLVITQHKKSKKLFLESRLAIKIAQKSDNLLVPITARFGGYVWYRQSNGSYLYSSISFMNALQFIKYLDEFQLIGSKWAQYKIWRQAYVIIQEGLHN